MNQEIYGIDINKDVTPLMVRDAISQCFFEAHCEDTGLDAEGENIDRNKAYCHQIVEKAFKDAGGNFEDPSKEDILGALEELKEFSKNFRDQTIVQKHFSEVMGLVYKLE